ncbi:MAG: TolC family protein [Nitrospirae bacterium]|nr:TolC family protein [Nitrospirota bacterium]
MIEKYRSYRDKIICSFIVYSLLCLSVPMSSDALTLDEALSLAKEKLPSYKSYQLKIRSFEALHNASLSPYLPSLDLSSSQARHFNSGGDYNSQTYDVSLSYILFDGGVRRANRDTAWLNLKTEEEGLRKNLLDLQYNVKAAFYNALAWKEILDQRKIQMQDAQKDLEVAEGRHKFGVARLSDVLQASVRYEQARFNHVHAEGDFRKALSELNSLIGMSLDSQYELSGLLRSDLMIPDRNKLYEAALNKPEIRQYENAIKISQNNKTLSLSAFYPNISMNASYSYAKSSGAFASSSPEDKSVGVTATWNIFELSKFFNLEASEHNINVSKEELNELKRQSLLDVQKAFEDMITASNKLKVAKEQLKQAEHNYSQALGEYKVGKGDILSLVQAESLLSNAREQLINSKLNLISSETLLERYAGVDGLESLGKTGQ